jgi:hypothetical protein
MNWTTISWALFSLALLNAQPLAAQTPEGGSSRGPACLAPSTVFIEGQLREALQLSLAEAELKEIVSDPRVMEQRTGIQALHRRTYFSGRRERPLLERDLARSFQEILDLTGRGETIENFPMAGARGQVRSADNGTLMIALENLPSPEVGFLPEQVKAKLGRTAKIHYRYPLDRFDYVISYGGEELALPRALQRLQDDFEDACVRRSLENEDEREKRQQLRPSPRPSEAVRR